MWSGGTCRICDNLISKDEYPVMWKSGPYPEYIHEDCALDIGLAKDVELQKKVLMLAWGEEHEITIRESEYYGPLGVYKTDGKVYLAEIRVGLYPYAGWGITEEAAVQDLRRRIKRAEKIYDSPPQNTTDWHKITRGDNDAV